MRIGELEAGARFALTALPEITGTVQYQSPGGTTVEYDGGTLVKIETWKGDTSSFVRRFRCVISDHTEVTPTAQRVSK